MEVKSKVAELDLLIGRRIKQRRTEIKMSQSKLGERLGVSFQQVQKYENGKNRVSASTLFKISQALGIDFSYFVDNLDKPGFLHDSSCVSFRIRDQATVDLLQDFSRISNSSVKKAISDLVKKTADFEKKR